MTSAASTGLPRRDGAAARWQLQPCHRDHPGGAGEARLNAQRETFELTVDPFMTSVTTFPVDTAFTLARA